MAGYGHIHFPSNVVPNVIRINGIISNTCFIGISEDWIRPTFIEVIVIVMDGLDYEVIDFGKDNVRKNSKILDIIKV